MSHLIRFILLLVGALLIITESTCGSIMDDSSEDMIPVMIRRNDFFLKAAKSVPRIGRRNDFFFAKNLKSVPRIGRRNDFFLKAAKSVPRIGRRDEITSVEKEASVAWPWFRDHDFIPRVMKKDLGDEDVPVDEPSKEKEEPRLQAIV
ncbi:unnamed protein product [Nezara viridula]|uniref:Neuropeptide n=1 Tax=Nezara viridula TaxID=85310 RepID=A0A3S5HJS0_NEZVI|nr:neuropeptide precursor [Nezara viridula]CAH1401681.1 unnamed protein product [Nezara viridula]